MTATTSRKALAIALIVGVCLGVFEVLQWAHQRAPAGAYDQAEFLADTGASLLATVSPMNSSSSLEPPPAQAAGWQPVDLPHVWRWPDPHAAEYGWYRLRVDVHEVAASPQAVLLMQVSMNARVWLNGELIGDGGRMDDPVARNWFRPLFFRLPAGAIRTGVNELLILERASPPGKGFLGRVYVGNEATLRPAYEERHFLKVTLLHLNAVLLLAVSLPMGLLAFWQRDGNVYFWMAVGGLLLGGHIVTLTVADIPLPTPVWDWLFVALVTGFNVSIIIAAQRFVDIRQPVLDRAMLTVCAFGNVALGLIAVHDLTLFHLLADGFWMPGCAAMCTYAVWLLLRQFWKQPGSSQFWLMVTAALLLLIGPRDMLALNYRISPVDGFYVHFIAPSTFVVFLSFCWGDSTVRGTRPNR